MAEKIQLTNQHGSFPAYAAKPTSSQPWDGVVILHDIMGMTADLQRQTDWLAEEGFFTIAPNLLAHGNKALCTIRAIREILKRKGRAYDDIDTACSWLTSQEGFSGKLGVVGFCFGGGFAVLLAPTGRFDVASINYGMLPKDAEQFLSTSCPIVASFGEKDGSLRGSATRLEKILQMNDIPHDVKEYAGVQHAFMNQHQMADVPWIFRIMSYFTGGSTYNAEAEADSRACIVRFFRQTLR